MRSAIATELMRRLLAMCERPEGELPPETRTVSVDRYRDPGVLELERARIFRRYPLIVAHESELTDPGAFVTLDVAGVPLLVLRGSDGVVRVFINACRHRGARLVPERCGSKKALTCRYHAWTYDLEGALFHVPGRELFGKFDEGDRGLRELPSEVRHGFVWARLDGEPVDAAAFLGPAFDDDLAAFELASHAVHHRAEDERDANWKLVMDAFAEGYHVKSLHRTTLARFFLEGSIVDHHAPHIRQVGARKSLLETSEPVESLDIREHATVFYDLFPNSVLVFHPDWVSQVSVFPLAVDRLSYVHRMLVPPSDEDRDAHFDKTWQLIDGTVFTHEDFAICESIQSTLTSDHEREFLAGGFERGLVLFHEAVDAALAD